MKISELTLQTNNLAETENFYSSVLGFKIIEKTQKSVSFLVGNSTLIFENSHQKKNPIYHFAFNIPFNKLEESMAWISQKIPLIETDEGRIVHFENWRAKAIYFYDNNQNILEFICREDLKNSSEKEFATESILSINEVGIVVEKPLLLGNEVIQKTKTNFFSKGPKREDFVALGDDEGLFVISNPERNWFPTKDLAKKQKIKVKILVNGTEFELEFN